jgi:hypothetical protein
MIKNVSRKLASNINNKRGMAFITVLMVSTMLSLGAAAYFAKSSQEAGIVQTRINSTQGLYAAESAVEWAKYQLTDADNWLTSWEADISVPGVDTPIKVEYTYLTAESGVITTTAFDATGVPLRKIEVQVSKVVIGDDDGDDEGYEEDYDEGHDEGHDEDHGSDYGDHDGDHDEGHDEDHDEDHDSDRITICHIPPGNPSERHTITIGSSALAAHLDHGDTVGACSDYDDHDDGHGHGDHDDDHGDDHDHDGDHDQHYGGDHGYEHDDDHGYEHDEGHDEDHGDDGYDDNDDSEDDVAVYPEVVSWRELDLPSSTKLKTADDYE